MRFLAVALAAAVTAATPASANPFTDLSRNVPAVDEAIRALPSSGVEGAFHRLAGLLDEPRLDADGQIPLSLERQIVLAAEALERRLRAGLPDLDVNERLVLAQVTDAVALEPGAALYLGRIEPAPCADPEQQWGRECHPPVGLALDRLAALLEASLRDGFAQWALENGAAAPPVPPSPAGGIDADNFGAWLDSVIDGPARITGAETIDD